MINAIVMEFSGFTSHIDTYLVEGDLKVPFSIATTPRCGEGCYSFPWTAPLYP